MYPSRPGQEKRNDQIEALRAYSVLMVLFEHLTVITHYPQEETVRTAFNGWTGVDLFFCISGFVIYRSLSPVLSYRMPWADAIPQVVAFWIRRFWRLAPAAWLWLALGIPAMLTYRYADVGFAYDNAVDGIAALLNFENFHRYSCNVENQPCGALYPTYWSLSLEAQFYVLLPFAIVLLRKRWLAAGLLLLIAVQFPQLRPANGTGIGWFIRTDAIAWGILLSQLWEAGLATLIEPRFLRHPVAKFVFTFGFIFLLGSSQMFWREHFFVGLAGIFTGCLVWAASYNAGYISRPFGTGGVLNWIGTRSFSLYVVHIVMFMAARHLWKLFGIIDITPLQKVLYLGTAYGGTFLAAVLTYNFVEQPLRRRGRTYTACYLERHAAMAVPGRASAD